MRKITAVLAIGICLVAFATANKAQASDFLQATEHQITSDTSCHNDGIPTVGHDATGYYVVYTSHPIPSGQSSCGVYSETTYSSIYYQRLDANGAPTGSPITVADSPVFQWLDDTSGDYIVYTLSPAVGRLGNIELYRISTSQSRPLTSSGRAWSPRIYGDVVVWIEFTTSGAGQAAMYKISSGVPVMSTLMAGPIPPVDEVVVGDRFIVWSQLVNNQYDLAAYDMQNGLSFMVANNPALSEIAPSTECPWIAFVTDSVTAPAAIAIKAINIDTQEIRTIVDNGANNTRPCISGNLISYESNVSGKSQIYVYRIQQGDTFQVTSGMYNEQISSLKGNLVTYVDNRNGYDSVFVSTLSFVSDTMSPITTGSVSPSPNGAGWNNTLPVTVTLTSTDNPGGSGVKSITYTLSGAQTGGATISSSTCSFTISTEGVTTVSFYGRDNAGNIEATKTLVVSIDKTPPVLSTPTRITVNATSSAGAVVTYSVTAKDNVDPNPAVSCVPASGSTVPIGTTTVNCTASDAAGNSSSASFQVVVGHFGDLQQATEYQITSDANGHSTPIIGHDSIGDLIVYSQYSMLNGYAHNASLYYQRLANGAPTGAPVTVADSPENQWLNDVSGDYIVYTLSPAVGQLGNIELYQIGASQSRPLTSSGRAW